VEGDGKVWVCGAAAREVEHALSNDLERRSYQPVMVCAFFRKEIAYHDREITHDLTTLSGCITILSSYSRAKPNG
jgi:hypothetical protein